MDPLSLTASLIAVLGASATVAKQLNLLRETHKISSSTFYALLNELSDLQVVLGACECALVKLSDSSAREQAQVPLADVSRILSRIRDSIAELEKLVSTCFVSLKEHGSKAHLAKLKWVRQKENVRKLQNRIREGKQDLLVILESHSAFAISSMQMSIQEISMDNREKHAEMQDRLDNIMETLSARMTSTEDLRSGISDLSEKLEHLALSRTNSLPPYTKTPSYQGIATDVQTHDSDSEIDSVIQLRASCYRKTCRPWCSCCCHARKSVKTPKTLKGFVGSLFLGYSGVPFMTPPCNEQQCTRRSTLRFIVNYQFPAWFWTRALFASLTTANLPGPEMLIRVQTTVPFASITYQHCLNGNVIGLQRLFQQRSASPFDVDPDGVSLLHNALRFSHYDVCKLLVASGADLYQEDHTGISPYHFAWDAILLDPESFNKKQALLELFPQDEGGLDERQFSRIHKCVLGLIGTALDLELSISTSSINEVDNVGRSPLYWAASRGDAVAVSLLLQFGAKADLSTKGGSKDRPLHAAARSGNAKIVTQLLHYGAAVDSKDEGGMTPLFWAVGQNDGNDCLEVLLNHGANIEAEDTEQRTPVMQATQNGMLCNALFLIKHGADIDKTEIAGWTPLASCIFWNMHESIEMLLEHGANPLCVTNDQETLLHVAARYADIKTLELLSKWDFSGISLAALDSSGKNAQEVAVEREDERKDWHEAFHQFITPIFGTNNVKDTPSNNENVVRNFLGELGKDTKATISVSVQVMGDLDQDDEDDGQQTFEDAMETLDAVY